MLQHHQLVDVNRLLMLKGVFVNFLLRRILGLSYKVLLKVWITSYLWVLWETEIQRNRGYIWKIYKFHRRILTVTVDSLWYHRYSLDWRYLWAGLLTNHLRYLRVYQFASWHILQNILDLRHLLGHGLLLLASFKPHSALSLTLAL